MQGGYEGNDIAILQDVIELSLELPIDVIDNDEDARPTIEQEGSVGGPVRGGGSRDAHGGTSKKQVQP